MVSLLLCLTLAVGVWPMNSAQARENGQATGLVAAQALNSCQIALVFDGPITYAGGEALSPLPGTESGEWPPEGGLPPLPELPSPGSGLCEALPDEGGAFGIVVAEAEGDALDIARVVHIGYGLLLVLAEPLAEQELLEVSIEAGTVGVNGNPAYELAGYRLMTPLGELRLMDRLDPQRTGFQIGHVVRYMRSPGAVSIVGTAGIDDQDARSLLALIESGPVDLTPLGMLLDQAGWLLDSGPGYPEAQRQQLQDARDAASLVAESANPSHRAVREQIVLLERAAVAFERSYEAPLLPLATPLAIEPAADSLVGDGVFHLADLTAAASDAASARLTVTLPAAGVDHTPYAAGDRVTITAGPGAGSDYVLTANDVAELASASLEVTVDVTSGYRLLAGIVGQSVVHEATVRSSRMNVPSAGTLQADTPIWIDTVAPLVELSAGTVEYAGELEASSSEAGMLVLVPASEQVSGPEDLRDDEGDYSLYPAREVVAEGSETFDQADWAPGDYVVYAVDASDNLSVPAQLTVGHPDQPVVSLQAGASEHVELPASPNPEVWTPYGMTAEELLSEQLEVNSPYTLSVVDGEGLPVAAETLLEQGMRVRIGAPYDGEWVDYHIRLQAVAATMTELQEGLERLADISAIKLTQDIVGADTELTLPGDTLLRATGGERVLEVQSLDAADYTLTRSGVLLVVQADGDEALAAVLADLLPDRVRISGLEADGYDGLADRSSDGSYYYAQDAETGRVAAFVATPAGLRAAWPSATHLYLAQDIELPEGAEGELGEATQLEELAASTERTLSAASIAAGWEAGRQQVVVIDRSLSPLTAAITRLNVDSGLHGFKLEFDAPISAITRAKGGAIVDSIKLYYGGEEDPVAYEDFSWYWVDDKEVEIHKTFGVNPIGLRSVEIAFTDERIVSQAGAVYPASTPVVYTAPLPLAPPTGMGYTADSTLADGMLNLAERALLGAGQGTAFIEVELSGEVEEGYALYSAGDEVVVEIDWEEAGSYTLTAEDIAALVSGPITVTVDVSDHLLRYETDQESEIYAGAWVRSSRAKVEDSDAWQEQLPLKIDLIAPSVTGAPSEQPFAQPLAVSSSETGTIVLAPDIAPVATLSDLMLDGNYRYPHRVVSGAGESVSFTSADWEQAGEFVLVAVDEAGNLSESIPVTILSQPAEEPFYALAGALRTEGPIVFGIHVWFSKPLKVSDGWLDRIEVDNGFGDPIILNGSELEDIYQYPDTSRFDISFPQGSNPWLDAVEEIRVYFTPETVAVDEQPLTVDHAVYRPLAIEDGWNDDIYVPEQTPAKALWEYLTLRGETDLAIRDAAGAAVASDETLRSGMEVWQAGERAWRVGIQRLLTDDLQLEDAVLNAEGIDRIKYAFAYDYYERRPGGHFRESEGGAAIVVNEATFRSALADEGSERLWLMHDIDVPTPVDFPDREFVLDGDGVHLTIRTIMNFRFAKQSITEGVTVTDTSMQAPPAVAYLPEVTELPEGGSIRIDFVEPFSDITRNLWLPRIKQAFVSGFDLLESDISVTVDPQDERVVVISNDTDSPLDFSVRNIYLLSEYGHPFSPQVKIFDNWPLTAQLTLLEGAEPGTTKLSIDFNQMLEESMLELGDLVAELDYWDGEWHALRDQIVSMGWITNPAGQSLVLTIEGYEHNEAAQHNLRIVFQPGAITTDEGDKLRPNREFTLLPSL